MRVLGPLQIEGIIPHRGKAQLLSMVQIDEESGEVVGYFIPQYWMCEGHFPGNPVVPGIFILEAINLTIAVAGMWKAPPESKILLREPGTGQFRRQVKPGELVIIRANLTKSRAPMVVATGVAVVGSELVIKLDNVKGAIGKPKEEKNEA